MKIRAVVEQRQTDRQMWRRTLFYNMYRQIDIDRQIDRYRQIDRQIQIDRYRYVIQWSIVGPTDKWDDVHCLQTLVKDHPASLGMTCDHTMGSHYFSLSRQELPMHISSYPDSSICLITTNSLHWQSISPPVGSNKGHTLWHEFKTPCFIYLFLFIYLNWQS